MWNKELMGALDDLVVVGWVTDKPPLLGVIAVNEWTGGGWVMMRGSERTREAAGSELKGILDGWPSNTCVLFWENVSKTRVVFWSTS